MVSTNQINRVVELIAVLGDLELIMCGAAPVPPRQMAECRELGITLCAGYGRTKLAGEQALMEVCPDSVIIRTAWLYSEYGNNFMKTVLRLGKERDELRFIFDQVGTPTYAGDLAVAMLAVLERAEAGKFIPGIYHFSDEGVCSWYDFTVKILQIAGMNNRVIPIETKDYPTPASRPHYSVLNKGKIKSSYGLTIPHWETSLAYCMNNKV